MGGPAVRIPLAPAVSHSLQVDFPMAGRKPRYAPQFVHEQGRQNRPSQPRSGTPGAFSLSAIDAVPPGKSVDPYQRHADGDLNRGPRYLSLGLQSTCEQLVLLAPVERQIEMGEPRRGERDGLAALQDRLDQLRPQER